MEIGFGSCLNLTTADGSEVVPAISTEYSVWVYSSFK